MLPPLVLSSSHSHTGSSSLRTGYEGGALSKRVLLALALLLALLLYACGDNGSNTAPQTGGNEPPPPPASTPSKFVYSSSGFEADGVDGGVIDRNTGQVQLVSGSPFLDGLAQGNLEQVIADPLGRFLFTFRVQSSSFGMPLGFNGIGAFQIDATSGALTKAPNAPLIFSEAEGNGNNLAIDGRGRFLYEPAQTTFSVFIIDQNSGAISRSTTPGTATPVGSTSLGSPDGNLIFNAGDGKLQAFSIDQTSGALSPAGTPVNIASDNQFPVVAMAVQRDGRVLYVSSGGKLVMFDVATSGQLTPKNTPFSIPLKTTWLALTPDGKYLYPISILSVNGQEDNYITGFAVDSANASIQAIPGFANVKSPAFAIDGAGSFAFVTDFETRHLLTFSIDSGTGKWRQMASSPGTQIGWIADLPADIVAVP